MKRKLTFVDLFAGCGGLSEGFMTSGHFEGLAHVEWEKPMVETLRFRLQEKWEHTKEDAFKRVVHFDIQQTNELLNGIWSEESIKKFGNSNHLGTIKTGIRGLVGKKRLDVVIGGPPCQAYSIAGRAKDPNGMKDDYRNYLFESFIEVVKKLDAKVFVFENVPGMLSACPGGEAVTERIFKSFDEAGYEIRKPVQLKKCVYSATQFGVPQDRKRVIIIGVKRGSGFSVDDIYSELDSWLKNKNVKPREVTVRSAIGDRKKLIPSLTSDESGKKTSHVPENNESLEEDDPHRPRYHNARDIQIFREWVRDGWNKKTLAEKQDFYHSRTGKQSNHAKYRSLDWEKPSPTIVAHLNKDGLLFIHPDPEQARTITVHEAALLQSFPDDYKFEGQQGVCYKMIGNAVPPKMAEGIANAIANAYKKQSRL